MLPAWLQMKFSMLLLSWCRRALWSSVKAARVWGGRDLGLGCRLGSHLLATLHTQSVGVQPIPLIFVYVATSKRLP